MRSTPLGVCLALTAGRRYCAITLRDAVAALARTGAFKEGDMAVVGLAVTFAGFLISALSVGVMSGNGGRLVMVLAGIVISLFGIFGLINPAYQQNAVWKR